MNRAGVLSLVLMSSGLVCGAPPAPTLTLSADRPSAVYACGEEAAVTIRVSDAQGGSTWQVRKCRGGPAPAQTFALVAH